MPKPKYPLTILVDTREQTPFTFSPCILTERVALPVGDYSIKGASESGIIIERKSIEDLCGSLTAGRDRFIRELRQFRSYQCPVIMVEASWEQINMAAYRSRVLPQSIFGSLMSITIKYKIIPIMAENHEMGSILTEKILLNYARIVHEASRKIGAEPEPESYPGPVESGPVLAP